MTAHRPSCLAVDLVLKVILIVQSSSLLYIYVCIFVFCSFRFVVPGSSAVSYNAPDKGD